jgi:regulator of protease activity HflC (stomatin/prohibitin superfamily)
VRQFLAGRAELTRLAAEGTALDQRAEQLQEQLERQADPAYQERQARERLAYVLPGDRLVVVVDGEAVEGDAGTVPESQDGDLPWYEALLQSVAVADGDEEPEG